MPPAQLLPLFNHYLPILNRHFRRGRKFDSHAFIKKLTKHHQAEYVDALPWYKLHVDPRPFRPLHRALAKLLRQPGLNVDYRGRGKSNNIFGDDVSNAKWERT